MVPDFERCYYLFFLLNLSRAFTNMFLFLLFLCGDRTVVFFLGSFLFDHNACNIRRVFRIGFFELTGY